MNPVSGCWEIAWKQILLCITPSWMVWPWHENDNAHLSVLNVPTKFHWIEVSTWWEIAWKQNLEGQMDGQCQNNLLSVGDNNWIFSQIIISKFASLICFYVMITWFLTNIPLLVLGKITFLLFSHTFHSHNHVNLIQKNLVHLLLFFIQ